MDDEHLGGFFFLNRGMMVQSKIVAPWNPVRSTSFGSNDYPKEPTTRGNAEIAEPKPNKRVEDNSGVGPGLNAEGWLKIVRSYANEQGLKQFNKLIAGTMSPVLHGPVNKDVKPGDRQVEVSGPGLGLWTLPTDLEYLSSSDTVFILLVDHPLAELPAGAEVEFRGIPLPLRREDLAKQKTFGDPRNPGTAWSSLNIRFNVRLDDLAVKPASARH